MILTSYLGLGAAVAEERERFTTYCGIYQNILGGSVSALIFLCVMLSWNSGLQLYRDLLLLSQ